MKPMIGARETTPPGTPEAERRWDIRDFNTGRPGPLIGRMARRVRPVYDGRPGRPWRGFAVVDLAGREIAWGLNAEQALQSADAAFKAGARLDTSAQVANQVANQAAE